jgi:hypothetical protein
MIYTQDRRSSRRRHTDPELEAHRPPRRREPTAALTSTEGRQFTARLARGAAALVVAAGFITVGGPARAQVPPEVDPRLFVIGDSVLLGAREAIAARMTGWSLNVYAQEGLSTLAAPSIIAASRTEIGEVAVAALGNNDAGNPVTFAQRVDGVMQAFGPIRRVIWVNLRSFASWTPALDQQLTAATARWPNLVVADWNTRSATDPTLVYGDGLHLTPGGQAAMADLIAGDVSAYVQQRLASSTTTTTTTTVTHPTTRRRPGAVRRPAHQRLDVVPWIGGGVGIAVFGCTLGWTWRRARRRRGGPL